MIKISMGLTLKNRIIGNIVLIGFGVFGFHSAWASQPFRITIEKKTAAHLNETERAAMSAFLGHAQSKLPDSVKKELDGEVEVELTDIQSDWAVRCRNNQAMGIRLGSAHGKKIKLERSFLSEILKGEQSASHSSRLRGCSYQNGYDYAMGVLVHELARIYDHQLGLSKNPMLRTLLGEAELGAIVPMRRHGELVSTRSPDISEFESAEEGFAVNFERFLLDPEYSCRRPNLAHAFMSQVRMDPFPARACQVNDVVPLSQEEVTDSLIHFVRLDPSRLYQVHYLFASKGQEAMSRWGHAMYRLVFCAPFRKVPGPDCLKDISYHVVVSFRANVQDLKISSRKGLEGDYPSQLYLLSLLEVMREYNSDGLRDLVSLPLKLTQEQTQEFLERSIQLFWEYRGKYMFLSNNCATEALNLLKSVYPDSEFQKNVHVLSPVGLYNELKTSGLMDDRVLADSKLAAEQGYLFPSERSRLTRAFESISKTALKVSLSTPFDTLENYVQQSKAQERKNWYTSLSSQLNTQDRQVLAAHFFILESYLVRTRQSEFYKQVAELLQTPDAQAKGDSRQFESPQLKSEEALRKNIDRARALQESLSPQGLTVSGYGIALPSDYRPTMEQDAKAAGTELSQIFTVLRQYLETQFPDQFHELSSTVENRKFFAQSMK